MFIRKKKNKSGSTSIQIISKNGGKYRVVKTIGNSFDESDILQLQDKGKFWIKQYLSEGSLFSEMDMNDYILEEKSKIKYFLSNIESISLNGARIILDNVFKQTGFDVIDDDVLKELVIARLCQPMSKSGTVDYLQYYFDEDYDLSNIYRYLDKLYNTHQDLLQQISVEHTRKLLGGKIGLIFYDVTTLYFESDNDDDLRERGFSKDGKHCQPQVVLGLLVSKGGYPLAYSLFNGSQYEGRTMLPVVEDFIHKFNLNDFVVVADSGLMNRGNITMLEAGGYKYIIGARIKNYDVQTKKWILSLKKHDGSFYEQKQGKARLIIGYSDNRAKKDRYNREKGVRRLKKSYQRGTITKENINRRGYNKFLDISNDIQVSINEEKILDDVKWDGLKGYITNTNLPPHEVYEQYSGLWEVEKAYRVTKGTLEMRPMFHFTPRRIEAHVCICFVAYKVYKELERLLKLNNVNLSVDKALFIAKTVTTIKVNIPNSNEFVIQTMLLKKHNCIEKLFKPDFWVSH
jgi:transposase